VRLPSDLAPYLARCDVVFVGNGYAPPGTRKATVRMGVQRGDELLLDKRLLVHGARSRWDEEPKPFNRIPLDFEHAFGGPNIDDNPVGTGATGGVPNVIDATVAHRPGSFGAIGRTWPSRRRLLSAEAVAGLQESILDIPAVFDWSYFQAAPGDQRVPHLNGDEWLVLEGLIPGKASFKSQLPSARGMARVWAAGAQATDPGYPVALAADQLSILGDARMCTVTWRGSFPIESEQVLPALMIAAGVETDADPIDWSGAFRQTEVRAAVDLAMGDSNTLSLKHTSQRKADEILRAAVAKPPAQDVAAKRPLAITAQEPAIVELSDEDLRSTSVSRVILDDDTTAKVTRVNLVSETVQGMTPHRSPWQQVDPAQAAALAAARDAAPFQMTPAGRPVLRPVDIPGAPWSAATSQAVPRPADNSEVTRTVSFEALQDAKRPKK
jgi:hypothetical protein